MDSAQIEELKSKAIAHLRFKGTMEWIGLARSLGLSIQGGRVSDRFRQLIKEMEAEGSIVLVKGDSRYLPTQIRLADAASTSQPETRSESVKPESIKLECETLVDESLRGTWEPPKPKPRPVVSDQKIEAEIEREARKMRRKESGLRYAKPRKPKAIECETVQRLNQALEELIGLGKPFRIIDVCNRAGAPETAIYNHPSVLQKTRDAISFLNTISNSASFAQKQKEQTEAKVLIALKELIDVGDRFTQKEVAKRAAIPASIFKKNYHLRCLVNDAIRLITDRQRKQKEIAELQEQVNWIDRECGDLKQKIDGLLVQSSNKNRRAA